MNKYRYPLAFFIALLLHGLFLWKRTSFDQVPQHGLALGNSSLEVGLAAFKKEEKKEQKNIPEKASSLTSSFHQLPSPKKNAVSQKESIQGVVGSSMALPGYLSNPQPMYPEKERQAGHEGSVLLRVKISSEGKVENVDLERSSGYLLLDQRAVETVAQKWRFQPAMKNKSALASEVLIPIHFSLKSAKTKV